MSEARSSKRSRKSPKEDESNQAGAKRTQEGRLLTRVSVRDPKRLKSSEAQVEAGKGSEAIGQEEDKMGLISEDHSNTLQSDEALQAKYFGPNESIRRDEYVRLLTQVFKRAGLTPRILPRPRPRN